MNSIECFKVVRVCLVVCGSARAVMARNPICFSRRKKKSVAVEFTSLIVAVFKRVFVEYT